MGLTDQGYLVEGLRDYEKRLSRYTVFERLDVPGPKNPGSLDREELKTKEGQLLLSKLTDSDFLVLLDENGKMFSSTEFSEFLQQRMNSGVKNLVFFVGGAFGFSEEVRQRAQISISLSRMTLTHQMVRLFFTEQLYRGFTILRGEKYHHS